MAKDNSKVKRVSSLRDPDSSVMLVEFKGDVKYLTHDDVELYIHQFFKMREKLAEEKKLRKEYEALDAAWKEYKILLNLIKDKKD